MKLGIFAKTFLRPSLEEVLDAVQGYGLTQIQFNMACAGLPSLPDSIDPGLAESIGYETQKRDIHIAAVSGTYNMIHPDIKERQTGLNRLRILAASCKKMDTTVITLCTGTRNTESMWRKHPGNNDPSAWRDLVDSMQSALTIAEEYGVTLAIEPEVSNVIDSAEKAKKLLNEIMSPNLKIIMDAANLFHAGEARKMQEVLDKAFYLLGGDIVIAHAKDLANDGEPDFVAAGQGILDYDAYLKLLNSYQYNGALIIHGLAEHQVQKSVDFLKQKMVY